MVMKPLPPGEYVMRIDRVRKVRGKSYTRVHMTVIDTGQKLSSTIAVDRCTDPGNPHCECIYCWNYLNR